MVAPGAPAGSSCYTSKGCVEWLEQPQSTTGACHCRRAESGDEEEEGGRGGAVIPFYRIDGTTKLQERQRMIDNFNHTGCKVGED